MVGFSHSGSQILKSHFEYEKADDNYNAVISVEVQLWTNQHHSTLMSTLLLQAQRLTLSLGPSLSWRCSAGACSCQVGGASLWCLGCWHDDRPTLAINHIMNDKLKPLGKEGQSFDHTPNPSPQNKTKKYKKTSNRLNSSPNEQYLNNRTQCSQQYPVVSTTVPSGLNNSSTW